jgi:hypothetical protein
MMDNGLLKEVYEKGRKRKMATIPQKKPMPFPLQGGKGGPRQDKAREASTDAAKRRLQAMRSGKKPEAK